MIPKIAFLLDKTNDWLNNNTIFLGHEFKKDNLKIKVSKFYDHYEIENFDIVFILGYTKILPLSFLKLNALNVVIHESALPKYKGFAPIQHQLLEGKENITISLIEPNEDVDSGPILLQRSLNFEGTELYDEIRAKQAEAIILIINDFINLYPNFERKKQEGEETVNPKRNLKDSELDIKKSIEENFNLLRIGNNEKWPSFFNYKGKKYIIKIYEEKKNTKK